ncbi:hypothetical protein Ciccas_010999 [Cichlidogyrus casuarinus]|uniref:Cadherin domain-containing protein n=1 Tax=Cichlidogyrus casuarinus TaxID=1844966 RepID=A0ABD2PUJ4_9PLAT
MFRLAICVLTLCMLEPSWTKPDTSEVVFYVPEHSAVDTLVGDLSSYIPAAFLLPQLHLTLDDLQGSEKRQSSLFRVDKSDLSIRVNDATNLDRETLCPECSGYDRACALDYGLSLVLTNSPAQMWINVRIVISDVNDNKPEFAPNIASEINELGCLKLELPESTPAGTQLRLPAAVDLDSQKHGSPRYHLDTTQKLPFQVYVSKEGPSLQQTVGLDYELDQWFNLSLSVCDIGEPPHCNKLPICVALLDENDNEPRFQVQNASVTINETLPVGSQVTQFKAIDQDRGEYGQLRYSLITKNPLFWLNPENGNLLLAQPVEGTVTHKLLVQVRDSQKPDAKFAKSWVTITVLDVNNHAPEIKLKEINSEVFVLSSSREDSLLAFMENNKQPLDLAFVIATDKDSGANAKLNCSLRTPNAKYREVKERELIKRELGMELVQANIVTAGKAIYKLKMNKVFDREHLDGIDPLFWQSAFRLIGVFDRTLRVDVVCLDGGEPMQESRNRMHVAILDRNEHAPVFEREEHNVLVPENQRPGLEVLKLNLTDEDSPGRDSIARIKFLLEPATVRDMFTVDSAKGIIYTRRSFDAEQMDSKLDFEVSFAVLLDLVSCLGNQLVERVTSVRINHKRHCPTSQRCPP